MVRLGPRAAGRRNTRPDRTGPDRSVANSQFILSVTFHPVDVGPDVVYDTMNLWVITLQLERQEVDQNTVSRAGPSCNSYRMKPLLSVTG